MDIFYVMCHTQVVSFFYRQLLSVGLVAMSLWSFASANMHKHLVSFVNDSFSFLDKYI